MTPADVLKLIKNEDVVFVDLRFTDTKGKEQHVTVPAAEVDKTFLTGGKMFDGSSIEGFVRIEESDMYLKPDLRTFQVFPWENTSGEKVARLAA